MKITSLKKSTSPLVIFLVLILQAGNASAKKPDIDSKAEVTRIVEEKVALPSQSRQEATTDFSKTPINVPSALGLALDRNLELKARLSELQISLAELRQLGLVESPQVSFSTRFPIASPGSRVAYDLQLTQNILDLVQRSLRKKIGRSGYENRKWEAAAEILRTLAEVKIAYFRYQGTLQLNAFWRQNLATTQAATELMRQQRKAGNVSALEESQNLPLWKLSQLEYQKSQSAMAQERVAFAKLTGLAVDEAWSIEDRLPRLPAQDPKLEQLQLWSQDNRPDLVAKKQLVLKRQGEVDLAKKTLIPRLDVGVSADWDAEGNRELGPVVAFGMPFLGHRKAGIAKANAELDASQQSVAALRQGIPYDLDATYQRLRLARQTVQFYEKEILPVQDKVLAESLKHYNYMLLGNYQLLQAKQNQINARRDAIEALRDYWVAYAELENITGSSFEKIETASLASPPPEPKRSK